MPVLISVRGELIFMESKIKAGEKAGFYFGNVPINLRGAYAGTG